MAHNIWPVKDGLDVINGAAYNAAQKVVSKEAG
jgi:hypothetical protein